jgi:hypothetical protein
MSLRRRATALHVHMSSRQPLCTFTCRLDSSSFRMQSLISPNVISQFALLLKQVSNQSGKPLVRIDHRSGKQLARIDHRGRPTDRIEQSGKPLIALQLLHVIHCHCSGPWRPLRQGWRRQRGARGEAAADDREDRRRRGLATLYIMSSFSG